MQNTTKLLYIIFLIIMPTTICFAEEGRLTVLEGNASVLMIFEEGGTNEDPTTKKTISAFYHSADDDTTWGDPAGLAFKDSPPKLRTKAFEDLKKKHNGELSITKVIIGIAGFEDKDKLIDEITREEFHKRSYAEILGVDPGVVYMVSDCDLVTRTASQFCKEKKYSNSPLVLQLTTFAYGYTVNGEEKTRYFQNGERGETKEINGASWHFGYSVYSDRSSDSDEFSAYREALITFVKSKLKKDDINTQAQLLTDKKRFNVLGYLSMQIAQQKEDMSDKAKKYLAEKEALLVPAVQNVAGQLAGTDFEEKKPLIVIAGANYPLNIELFKDKLLPQSTPRVQAFCQGDEFLKFLKLAGAEVSSQLKSEATSP